MYQLFLREIKKNYSKGYNDTKRAVGMKSYKMADDTENGSG